MYIATPFTIYIGSACQEISGSRPEPDPTLFRSRFRSQVRPYPLLHRSRLLPIFRTSLGSVSDGQGTVFPHSISTSDAPGKETRDSRLTTAQRTFEGKIS